MNKYNLLCNICRNTPTNMIFELQSQTCCESGTESYGSHKIEISRLPIDLRMLLKYSFMLL